MKASNKRPFNSFALVFGSVAATWLVGRSLELVLGGHFLRHLMHAVVPLAAVANIVNSTSPKAAILPWAALTAVVTINEFFVAIPVLGTFIRAVIGTAPALGDVLFDSACGILSFASFYFPSASLIGIGALFSDAVAAIAGRVAEPKTLWAKLTRPMAIAEAAALNVGVMGVCMFAWTLGVLLYRSGFARRGAGGGFTLSLPPFEILHALLVAFPTTFVQSILARLPFIAASKYWVVPLVTIFVHQGIQFLRNQLQISSVGRGKTLGDLSQRISAGLKEAAEEVRDVTGIQAPGLKETKQQDVKKHESVTKMEGSKGATVDKPSATASGVSATTSGTAAKPRAMYNVPSGGHVPTGETTGQIGRETMVQ